MLTPQDIKEKKFEKALVGGYEMSLVDDFLERLTEDYSVLYRDNAMLKSKLKVLVEKVEEYRSTEDSMRMALLTAQKMASQITEEAQVKADAVVAEATQVAEKRAREAESLFIQEEQKLEVAKQQTAEFSRKVLSLINGEREFIQGLQELGGVSEVLEVPVVPVAPAVQQAAVAKEMPQVQESYTISDEMFDTKEKIIPEPVLNEPVLDETAFDLDAIKNSVDAFLSDDIPAQQAKESLDFPTETVQTATPNAEEAVNFKLFDQDHMDEQFAKTQVGKPEQSAMPYDRDLEKAEITRSISQALGDEEELIIDSKIFDDEGSPTTTRPKFDFGDLQFGANYDLDED